MSAHNMDSHMNFRMTSRDKNLIETAAKLRGLKTNTYARQNLLKIAEQDIIETNLSNSLGLNEEDWNRVLAIMEAPIKVNKNLQRAAKEFYKMIDEQ